MAVVGEYTPGDKMRPKKNSSTIYLPVTLEANVGRSSNRFSMLFGAGAGTVLWVLFAFGELTGSDGWGTKFFKLFVVTVIAMIVVRFVFLQEYKYRRAYSTLQLRNNEFDLSSIWNIISIDDVVGKPYFVHYRNGTTGLFVMMENDVVVGKPVDDEYLSYEALGDAYQQAFNHELDMEHLDIMDFIGHDRRLDYARRTMTERCGNPEIRGMMSQIFDNLQSKMNDNVTVYDIYVFHTNNMTNEVFYSRVTQVLQDMLGGNYSSYHLMNSKEIGSLVKSMFNLGSFSVVDSLITSYKASEIKTIKVLDATFADGTTKVYMQPYDRRKEEERRAQQSKAQMTQLKKREKERNRKNKRNKRNTGAPQQQVFAPSDSLEL